MPLADDEQPIGPLAAHSADPAFGLSVLFGAFGGVRITWMPEAWR